MRCERATLFYHSLSSSFLLRQGILIVWNNLYLTWWKDDHPLTEYIKNVKALFDFDDAFFYDVGISSYATIRLFDIFLFGHVLD